MSEVFVKCFSVNKKRGTLTGCHGGVAHKGDIDFRISYLTKVRERRIMRKIRQDQTVS